jgi:hypothetical protein
VAKPSALLLGGTRDRRLPFVYADLPGRNRPAGTDRNWFEMSEESWNWSAAGAESLTGAAIESVERDGETRVGRFGRRGRNGEDDVTAVNPW